MKTDNVKDARPSVNLADETLENLRRLLLDKFFAKTDDEEQRRVINKCVSTCIYALDKKLRLEEEIIDRLADCTEMSSQEVRKILTSEIDKFYGKAMNHYGMT